MEHEVATPTWLERREFGLAFNAARTRLCSWRGSLVLEAPRPTARRLGVLGVAMLRRLKQSPLVYGPRPLALERLWGDHLGSAGQPPSGRDAAFSTSAG